MNDENMALATLLGEPRRFPHGWRWFKTIRRVKDGELSDTQLTQVRALRRNGVKAHIYREPGTGYEVGVAARRNVTDRTMRRMAQHQLAYAEFCGIVDFNLFDVVGSEARAERLEELYARLDGAEH